MRDIKFRAWCKEYGLPGFMIMPDDFSHDEFITFDGNPIEVVAQEGWFEINGLKYELMQYTGLKDNNGKEIYEGDIVKGNWWDKGKSHRHIGVVKYGMASFSVVGIKQYLGMSDLLNPTYEIIGNIYENPELIES